MNGQRIQSDWVPIEPTVIVVTLSRNKEEVVRRKQFPLLQAREMTVRKSQRATYASVVHECDKVHPQKLMYVGLSRCTNLQKLYMTNATGDFSLHHGIKGNSDPTLRGEFQRLQKCPLETISRTCRTKYANIKQDKLTVALRNVRSLQCRATDVNHDELLRRAYSFATFKFYAIV